jgi:hypothetical protein
MKLLVLWALLFPLAVAAQVHKCQIDGKTAYTEAPCPTGTGGAVEIRENSLDASGQREQVDKIPKVTAPVRPRGGYPGPCDYIRWKGASPTKEESEAYTACRKRNAIGHNIIVR